MSGGQSPDNMAWERRLGLFLAVVVVAAFIYFVFAPPRETGLTIPVIRFLAALTASLSAYLFLGSFGLEAKLPFSRGTIQATGAFAVFIAVFFLFLYGIPPANSDSSPPSASTEIPVTSATPSLESSPERTSALPLPQKSTSSDLSPLPGSSPLLEPPESPNTEVSQEDTEALDRCAAKMETQNFTGETGAIQCFTDVIDDNPNSAGAYSLRSLSYLGINECRKALEDINNAIRINPQNGKLLGELYSFQGAIYSGLEDTQSAIESLQKAADIYYDQNREKSRQEVIRAIGNLQTLGFILSGGTPQCNDT